jgi:hypothetical protein
LTEFLKEKDHFGDLGVDGRIMLKHYNEMGCEAVDWISGAGYDPLDVTNLRVP